MMLEATAVRNGHMRVLPYPGGTVKAICATWLLCRTGGILVALPIEHVIEIMRVLPIEQVAGVPAYVRGLSIIRGTPVPVVDIGLVVNGVPGHAGRVVTVRAAARIIALAVDEVIGIRVFAAAALGELPSLLRDASIEAIAGMGALDAELLFFLHTGRLVAEDVLARLDAGPTPS